MVLDANGNPVPKTIAEEALERGRLIEGTVFDKPPPTSPPGVVRGRGIAVPEWFAEVHDFLTGVVNDEAVLLDLCFRRCVKMVEDHVLSGMVGIDHFPEAPGSGPSPNRMLYAETAVKMVPAFYAEVAKSLTGERKAEFETLIAAAIAKRDATKK